MPRIDTQTKLMQMYELFTNKDDGKLTSGEVEALAGFYKGLPASGKTKAKTHLISMYQDSQYTTGMKERFKAALLDAGLSANDLKSTPVGGLTVLQKQKLATHISNLSDDGSNEGMTKVITMNKVPWEAQSGINDALATLKKQIVKQRGPAEFGDMTLKAIYEKGTPPKLAGFTLEVGIYADDHDVDERLTFNKNGTQVARDYTGE